MKKIKMSSVILACLLTVSPLFTVTLCAQSSINYEMVRIPGGSFQMGNPDTSIPYSESERPVHTVTMSTFSIGKYEVTQALYESVMGYNPSQFSAYPDSPNRPVEQVTWFDAVEFCNKLSERERLQPVYTISDRVPATGYPIESATVTADLSKNGYRLPTEAQWEYVARGGNGSPGYYTYSGSNNVYEVAWYGDNSNNASQVVGTKKPNGLGIYDMSGNISEWCWDRYDFSEFIGGYYLNEAQTDPTGAASTGHLPVVRGGSWYESALNARSARRQLGMPDSGSGNLGFRLARP